MRFSVSLALALEYFVFSGPVCGKHRWNVSEATGGVQFLCCVSAFCGGHHEDPRAENHRADLQLGEDGLYRSQEVSLPVSPVCLRLQVRSGLTGQFINQLLSRV